MAAFTEKAIIDAFIRLLNEKPLDKIKVKDIIDECGINRSTFYYYYEDIFHLLTCLLEMETKKFTETHIACTSLQEGMMQAMAFAIENKRAIYHIYKSVSREHVEKYINTIFEVISRETVNSGLLKLPVGLNISEEDVLMVTDLIKFGLSGLVFRWLDDGMLEEPYARINKLCLFVQSSLQAILPIASRINNDSNK